MEINIKQIEKLKSFYTFTIGMALHNEHREHFIEAKDFLIMIGNSLEIHTKEELDEIYDMEEVKKAIAAIIVDVDETIAIHPRSYRDWAFHNKWELSAKV